MTTAICPRCHQELLPLAGIAATLNADAARAADAYQALLTMRLAMPEAIPTTLRGLSDRWPHLARALLCHAGTCAPVEQHNDASTPTAAPLQEGSVSNSKERNHS